MLTSAHPARPDGVSSADDVLVAGARRGLAPCSGRTEEGRLPPGEPGGVAVLDRNVLTVRAEELAGTRSVMTLVDGEIIHEAGALAREVPR